MKGRIRAASDGSHYELMDDLKTVPLPIVDNFMTTSKSTQEAVGLFEAIEARKSVCITLIAFQLDPNEWHLRIEGELVADSILNQIAIGVRYIDFKEPNMLEHFTKKKRAD